MQKPFPGKAVALQKMQRYCAFQERCHREVRQKLLDMAVYGDILEEIIAELVADNYLNEERFACTYARGKFRTKSWGRIRIEQELKMRKVSDYCIRKGLAEIDEAEYLQTLERLIQKKRSELANEDPYTAQQKIAQFALRKGYEADLIWSLLKS